MTRPSAASLLVFMAAGALLVAASPRVPSAVAVDRDFLSPLEAAVEDWDLDRAAPFFWGHFDELVYLTRKGDPQAIRVVQHLMLHESLPGACACCSDGLREAVFANAAMPPGFLDQVQRLNAPDQARILTGLDYVFKDTPGAGYEEWSEDRARYLAEHQPAALLYQKPDFESPTTPGPPSGSEEHTTSDASS